MRNCVQKTVLSIVCAAWSALSLGQEVECPTWALNDTWTYRRWELPAMWDGGGRLPSVRTFTIVRVRPNNEYPYTAEVVTKQEYAPRETKTAHQNFSRALNWFYRENPTVPWTELEFLRWPLVVGKSWHFTNPWREGANWEWHVTVTGWEEISVPAGKFKTIVVKAEAAVVPHYTQSRTIWYSPDVKRFVKQEFRGFTRALKGNGELLELESFSVK